MEYIISAILLGLAGSFHCAGMCGPIAVALPLVGDNWGQKVLGGLFYNIGRTVTYGLMGIVFGFVGQGLEMVGFQQWVSIIMGIIMIASVAFPTMFKNQYSLDRSMFKFVQRLKNALKNLFTRRSYKGLFLIGFVNGFLPCGLVYVALAGAIGTGDVLAGMLFMIIFGLGTSPMMLGISLIGNMASARIRNKVNKFIPVVVVVVGIFFILSGLNLGIPLISPKKEKIEQKFQKSLEKNKKEQHKQTDTDTLNTEKGNCQHIPDIREFMRA